MYLRRIRGVSVMYPMYLSVMENESRAQILSTLAVGHLIHVSDVCEDMYLACIACIRLVFVESSRQGGNGRRKRSETSD